jgi:hypothetical protein
MGGMVGLDRPCGSPIARIEEILQTAFAIDIINGGGDPVNVYRAGDYVRGRMRAVANFEAGISRQAGRDMAGIPADGEGIYGDGFGEGRPGYPPGGYPSGPSEPILPPDMPPLPDPPPDDPVVPGFDPNICEHIAELCITLYQEAAAALMGDPFIDLLATVEPECLCHNYDPNLEFVGRPAAGREFPVPLGDLRLIFRGTDITNRIIQPTTAHEIRFTIPPNSQTGYVYLRGLFAAERHGIPNPERLCGMSMPDFPQVPMNGPPALISIIFPPVIDKLTADGEEGPSVIVDACRPVDVCWHAHLEDQAPNLPLPPCGRIDVIVRNEAGDVLHNGNEEGCYAIAGAEDQALTVEAISYAGNHECGRAGPQPITLERIERVTLVRDVPADENLVHGDDGSFFVDISCPAPAGACGFDSGPVT